MFELLCRDRYALQYIILLFFLLYASRLFLPLIVVLNLTKFAYYEFAVIHLLHVC